MIAAEAYGGSTPPRRCATGTAGTQVPRQALGAGPRCERLAQHLAGAGGAQPLGRCPKGLRHGFGVQAVSRDIAADMVQRRLGHARLTTAAVHENVVGEKERSSAARMW